MKKAFLMGAVLAALAMAPAVAADLAMHAKAPALMPVPLYNWTGCYIGVHGGGGAIDHLTAGEQPGNIRGTGGVAGGQLGCNYQMTNWVFGIEGEGYWSGMKATFDGRSAGTEGSFFSSQTTNKSDYTIAGRMGVAFDRTLIYGKAGWVWGRFNTSDTGGNFGPGFTIFETDSWGGTLNGPLFGVGIEYAITENWTTKLEYNYLMFGNSSFPATHCAGSTGVPTVCVPGPTFSLGADKQLFKFGVNYKFNWGAAPLVARY